MRTMTMAAALLMTSLCFAQDTLVLNPGFEEAGTGVSAASWNGVADVYRRDDTGGHTGGASLHFVNTDSKRYVLCAQAIKLQPGRMYDFGSWVKTRGIEGPESGATICLEWSDAKGQYLGGAYPGGILGDNDWKYVSARSGRIPEEAATIVVACYVRQGMTGEAWWDDIQISLARQEPLSSILLQPNYRAAVADDGPRHAVVRATVDLTDYDVPAKDVVLKWFLLHGEKTIDQGQCSVSGDGKTDIRVPVRRLPHGGYTIRVTAVTAGDGTVLGTTVHPFSRVAPPDTRAAYIDKHNRIIVEGKPFFPLGMYWGSVDAKELEVYADSPFNCLMPYQGPDKAQMDLCQAKGLKVIYSVKDIYSGESCCPGSIQNEEEEVVYVRGKAEAFRDHPALLAWYINDELGIELLPRLAERRHLMEALDPGHPTWVVLYQVDLIDKYVDTFDAIGTDPYPIPARPAALAGEWTRKTVSGVQGGRPVWQVPQVFNWACYRKTAEEKADCRTPTLDEMRSMTWQCIAQGANGIVFYSWFDLHRDPVTPFDVQWPLVKQVAREVADYIPALLSIEKTPAITAPGPGGALWIVRRLAGKDFLFAVNPGSGPCTATFLLPRVPKTAFVKGTPLKTDGRRLRVELKPFEVRIIEMTG